MERKKPTFDLDRRVNKRSQSKVLELKNAGVAHSSLRSSSILLLNIPLQNHLDWGRASTPRHRLLLPSSLSVTGRFVLYAAPLMFLKKNFKPCTAFHVEHTAFGIQPREVQTLRALPSTRAAHAWPWITEIVNKYMNLVNALTMKPQRTGETQCSSGLKGAVREASPPLVIGSSAETPEIRKRTVTGQELGKLQKRWERAWSR